MGHDRLLQIMHNDIMYTIHVMQAMQHMRDHPRSILRCKALVMSKSSNLSSYLTVIGGEEGVGASSLPKRTELVRPGHDNTQEF